MDWSRMLWHCQQEDLAKGKVEHLFIASHLDCFAVPPRNDAQSDAARSGDKRTRFASLRGTKQSREWVGVECLGIASRKALLRGRRYYYLILHFWIASSFLLAMTQSGAARSDDKDWTRLASDRPATGRRPPSKGGRGEFNTYLGFRCVLTPPPCGHPLKRGKREATTR